MSLETLAVGFLTWLLWLIAMFIVGAIIAVLQMIFGIDDPKKKLAFGAGMLIGTVVTIILFGMVNPLGMSFGS